MTLDWTPWWADIDPEQGPVGLRLGQLELILSPRVREWRFLHRHLPEVVAEPSYGPLDGAPEDNVAYASSRIGGVAGVALRLRPALPDRPVITKLRERVQLQAGAHMTLYVGSPAWVAVTSVDQASAFAEFSSMPPQRAWWGASTRQGEVCYLSRTFGYLSLEEATLQPHRIITRVELKNEGKGRLEVDRVNLPVRRLSIHLSERGTIWTDPVKVEIRDAAATSKIDVVREAPAEAGPCTHEFTARTADATGLFRVVDTLFHP